MRQRSIEQTRTSRENRDSTSPPNILYPCPCAASEAAGSIAFTGRQESNTVVRHSGQIGAGRGCRPYCQPAVCLSAVCRDDLAANPLSYRYGEPRFAGSRGPENRWN